MICSKMLFFSAAAACLLFAANANAVLTHRFSFNNGTANDSVGTDNGVLVNGAAVTNGQLTFDPTINNGTNSPATGQYVSLPYNPVHTSNFTIEAWATVKSGTYWQRIIDFGNSVGGIGEGFIILTPYGGNNGPLGQISLYDSGGSGDTNYVSTPSVTLANKEHQFVFTHSYTTGVEDLYRDGNLIATGVATVDASQANYSDNYIGRSNFATDPYFDGSINELRTYDNALTAAQVAADYQAGPDGIPEPATLGAVAMAGLLLRRTNPSKRI